MAEDTLAALDRMEGTVNDVRAWAFRPPQARALLLLYSHYTFRSAPRTFVAPYTLQGPPCVVTPPPPNHHYHHCAGPVIRCLTLGAWAPTCSK
jgi:hypothetical protein